MLFFRINPLIMISNIFQNDVYLTLLRQYLCRVESIFFRKASQVMTYGGNKRPSDSPKKVTVYVGANKNVTREKVIVMI